LAKQKVRNVVDQVEQGLSKTSAEQIKDYVSSGIVIFFIVFALNLFLPWFFKLPLYFIVAKKVYRKRVKPCFPENQWIGWIYFFLCWWFYSAVF